MPLFAKLKELKLTTGRPSTSPPLRRRRCLLASLLVHLIANVEFLVISASRSVFSSVYVGRKFIFLVFVGIAF
jgi:hypothetical protein